MKMTEYEELEIDFKGQRYMGTIHPFREQFIKIELPKNSKYVLIKLFQKKGYKPEVGYSVFCEDEKIIKLKEQVCD